MDPNETTGSKFLSQCRDGSSKQIGSRLPLKQHIVALRLHGEHFRSQSGSGRRDAYLAWDDLWAITLDLEAVELIPFRRTTEIFAELGEIP